MSRINVLVVRASEDASAAAIAKAIADSVDHRPDMNLVEGSSPKGSVSIDEVGGILRSIDPSARCALVLVGSSSDVTELTEDWLTVRDDLAVMHVDVAAYVVRIGFGDSNLQSLLTALRELVDGAGTQKRERVARILRSVRPPPKEEEVPHPDEQPPHEQPPHEPPERPLLEAAINWVHALLRDAVESVSDENGDVHGFSITRATLLQSLDAPSPRVITNQRRQLDEVVAALDSALAISAENAEPLAVAKRVFRLDPLEFRLMVLTLASELDFRFQRCIGFLLDEMSRRVGTIGLYSSLLGITARGRGELINSGGLAQWFVFEDYAGRPAAADEPLRLDPFLTEWLLGDSGALQNDPRVRRTMRLEPWPGANVLQRPEEHAKADRIIEQLKTSPSHWVVLDADDPAAWRALLEIGSNSHNVNLNRIEATRFAGVDIIEIEECARRIGRMAQLTRNPLVIDVTKAEDTEGEDESLRVFLATLVKAECSAAVICRDEARILKLLEPVSYELVHEPALSRAGRAAAMRAAAKESGASLTEEAAEALADRFPLQVDGLEHAMELARARPKNLDLDDPSLARFITACKELSSEGISHLVERIEPVFTLDDVVLPPDRKQQLIEIVDNVRFASRVLDGWKFRDQLPYGRGVTALFYGSSGTGKTMAATGVSRELGVQMLRLDLSRVVSKYIGETEKNIDRVFTDAQKSGAAILIDEADALFGKRSEVKDAHDRYANIEVAYLLQRMEAYEGLAILTTNMRKNLDPAFLRRLRFIVDFPRPNVEAREQIWRQCLPGGSHELDNTEFRQLARRLDLTGGQIRQITLRAAFLAAAANSQITLEHIAHAARAELAKLGMPPVEIDLTQTRRAA